MRHTIRAQRQSAVTLVEVLVVIGIIVVVIGLLLSALPRPRGDGDRTVCMAQMRLIGNALFMAQDTYGSFPPLGKSTAYPSIDVNSTTRWTGNGSVQFRLLPFLDEGKLMLTWINAGMTTDTGANLGVPTPKIYLCPSDPSNVPSNGLNRLWTNGGQYPAGVAITNYVVNFQVWQDTATVGATVKVPASFNDGAATTGLVYERYGNCQNSQFCPQVWQGGADNLAYYPIAWGYSADPSFSDQTNWAANMTNTTPPALGFPVFQSQVSVSDCNSYNTQGLHKGMNVLMGDGSCRLILPSVSQTSWSAAITPRGHDKVGDEF